MRIARNALGVRARFALVLVVLVPALLGISGAAFYGLQTGRESAVSLYRDHFMATQAVGSLDTALSDAQRSTAELLLADDAADRQQLITALATQFAPAVDTALGPVAALSADNDSERTAVGVITANWAKVQALLASGTLATATASSGSGVAEQANQAFDAALGAAASIDRTESDQADVAYRRALSDYDASLDLILVAGLIGLSCAIGVVIWLIRSVLPRTLSYSAFAAKVGHGDYTGRLRPEGDDELAQLGRVLDELAESRQAEDGFERSQRELIDSLQVTESEQEAHDLLKRHLERSISGSEVTMLIRNNSADRLQAMTPLDPASPLAAGLDSAKPRSCLAVRKARRQTQDAARDGLLNCPVCSGCPGQTTCTPLIVGGEVIGSVLAVHEDFLADGEQRSIQEAVTQAAPVMGNLRNLAIAELRAATDSLTGLPNRRAIKDTIRRMVAQTTRTMSPLAALMCDLDHFKQVNDRYGHGRGDDVLAAVGAALTEATRISDFAGRYGGEEFLLLLPDTDAVGATQLAEKIRAAVAAIRVPDVDRVVTISVGVAVLPQHALDADSLERAADRALYTAKNNGRDRVEVFSASAADPAAPVQPSATALV